jgi:hypothetical protein
MHLGSIAVIGRLADLAVDLLADLRVIVVIMPPEEKVEPLAPGLQIEVRAACDEPRR